ncbi:uncharacterized protein LOC107807865 [Nicotiana tabacum]|uniref:Uncharacterized protein LOC107807865 n=1 Tax=Nicotiana tabacum TaxID=4097 RepID=A0AC58S6Y3_TOBAC
MLTLSRMKSLLYPMLSRPTTAPLSFCFHFQEPIFVCRRYGVLTFRNQTTSVQTINPMNKVSSFSCSTVPNHNQIRVLHTEVSGSDSGEVHVIVGPMFAGKTTTLLKRIKSESSNGRKAYKKGKRVHWQMIIVGFVPNEYLTIKLLILYAKAGDLDTAHIIFDKLQFKCLVSWNAMIAGYVQKGMEEIGMSLYHNMKQRGVLPDQYTFASVFRACASLAVLEQGKQAHALLIKSQISGNIVVNSALMDMYFKCSCPSDGYLVFSKSLERNVITWTALISGYGQNGRIKDVLESFHRMIDEGFRPNHITFLAVLSACSHGGLVDRGKEYGLDSIVTHDGDRLPCWPLANLSSFKQRCGSEAYSKLEVIGIDEAQFFEDLYDFCTEAADHDGKIVIVAGLDGDYLRRSFGSVLDIIPIADTVTKLTSRCELCGKRASFTLRKTEETRTELIAGADVYMPVCRKHYVSGQVVKEATRSVLESQKVQCSSVL